MRARSGRGTMEVQLDMEVGKRRRSVRVATALACAGACLVGASAGSAATQAELTAQSQLLREVNLARKSRGIAPLKLSTILSRPARQHSAYLAHTGTLNHDSANGRPFYVRLYAAGFPRTKAVGENLGMSSGCSTGLSKTMVRMWLRSPGHRRNLLSRQFKVVGIGVVAARDCNSTIYATDFGG